ncbi:LuxR C-terminal-related transcriptional regulator [Nocardioides sp. LS1]|uniref:ATP-binding protein n=1 Tax=Nocardioides sp. LS1 TaxID=1027620 RepID=UPI000F617B4F|nr:LuxR C-terminal-related transcriptional regulator [Nocardioides sp. LS1]GCD88028.1 LuxR family transcriptional regulator [Nocardioides sp. LS1]
MPSTHVRIHGDNLPAEVSSFVGRRREVARLRQMLESARLVTVTGMAGVGKSRLALRAAHEVRRAFADGVWLVDLSALQGGDLVTGQVGVALGLSDHSGRWSAAELGDHVADRQLLLVLDNCDHLLDAIAGLLARLLRTAPRLRVIVTSAQPLGIAGEHVLAIGPLSLPEPDVEPGPPSEGLAHYEAINLFLERGRAASQDFEVTSANYAAVVRICRSLDGLPLALELAATRLRMLSPEQIASRIDDRFQLLTGQDHSAPVRQRSLEALLAWSYDLCSPTERALWSRLAVFSGDFDLDAAAATVIDDQLPEEAFLRGMGGLVDRSVVSSQPTEPRRRYRMLESIRQYGLSRLQGDEQAAFRLRHRDYFQRVAEDTEAGWSGPLQSDLLRRSTEEHHNLRAALTYSLGQPHQMAAGLRLAATMWPHWLNGYVGEGRAFLTRALEAVTEPSPARAKALWVDAYLRLFQGDISGAVSELSLSEEISNNFDDDDGRAHAVEYQGFAALLGRDWATASALCEKAAAMHRSLGNGFDVTMSLARWGLAEHLAGHTAQAHTCLQEAQAASEACSESYGRSVVHWMRGVVRFDEGDLQGAETELRESLRLRQVLRDHLGMAHCVEVLTWVATSGAAHTRAARLLGFAEALWRLTGATFFPHLQDRDEECHRALEGALGREALSSSIAEGARMGIDDGVAYALGVSSESIPRTTQAHGSPVLTRRQREIAALVAEGLSNREIAARLVISQRTAEAHVENILTKLGFTSRAQIASWVAQRLHD